MVSIFWTNVHAFLITVHALLIIVHAFLIIVHALLIIVHAFLIIVHGFLIIDHQKLTIVSAVGKSIYLQDHRSICRYNHRSTDTNFLFFQNNIL